MLDPKNVGGLRRRRHEPKKQPSLADDLYGMAELHIGFKQNEKSSYQSMGGTE
jgi:hypothetical protein